MMALFLLVWALDSFLVKLTYYGSVVPWYLRLGGGALVALYGAFLVDASHRLVIGVDEPVMIDWGVYSVARHPMYLGMMLVCLGLCISTLSGVSMLTFGGIYLVYDIIASYEEAKLVEKLDLRYLDYMKRVRRWLLF